MNNIMHYLNSDNFFRDEPVYLLDANFKTSHTFCSITQTHSPFWNFTLICNKKSRFLDFVPLEKKVHFYRNRPLPPGGNWLRSYVCQKKKHLLTLAKILFNLTVTDFTSMQLTMVCIS